MGHILVGANKISGSRSWDISHHISSIPLEAICNSFDISRLARDRESDYNIIFYFYLFLFMFMRAGYTEKMPPYIYNFVLWLGVFRIPNYRNNVNFLNWCYPKPEKSSVALVFKVFKL
jgi:hypothetical protein